MIRYVKINGECHMISKDPKELFIADSVKQQKCRVALIMMNDCLDYIYDLMKKDYPKIFKPEVYLSNSDACNAAAWQGKTIIIYAGLVLCMADFIEKKYTPELMKSYKVFQGVSHEMILSGIRVYFWRYIVLHELYHIWHQHRLWKQLYRFNEKGKVVKKIKDVDGNDLTQFHIENEENTSETETVLSLINISETERSDYLTQQACELDADSSAINMLISMMMCEIDAGKVLREEREIYICNEMGFLMAALAAAFSFFDGNAGAKFECLAGLENSTHPLPAIRMCYAEEIADACLSCYFMDIKECRSLKVEWRKVICDVEADYKGHVDMGQVFYYTAYTEKAQRHLCNLKHRMADMHDTMAPLSLANFAMKLEEEDMEFLPSFVWFTEDGKSTKGWINPATGIDYAIKAENIKVVNRNPFVRKRPKIGANDPCPCGSNKKFKKCCRGNGKYD